MPRLNDARDYQILFLLLFLALGIGTRDWTIQPAIVATVLLTCWITQWSMSAIASHQLPIADIEQKIEAKEQPVNLRSATITALGLCLLLRSDSYATMILAGVAAIASKFLFRFHGKHWFNPSNFGIIAALVLTNNAWVSPGQWGDDLWYALVFMGAGGIILKRVGRWDTSVAFLGVYALLEILRNLWLGWTWDVLCHRLTSGSLLLFALFMLSDPRSIPNARIGRSIWAACIAVMTFVLRNLFFDSTAMFWALFALSPLSILCDRLWSAPRFTWSSVANRQPSILGN